MIETRVRVVSIGDGTAWVEPTAQSGCGGCQVKSSCGVGGMSKVFRLGRAPIPVDCGDARPGEELVLSLDESDLLKASLLAYLLPAVLAIAAAAMLADYGDGIAALGTLGGGLIGLVVARLLSHTPRLTSRSLGCPENDLAPSGGGSDDPFEPGAQISARRANHCSL